MKINQLLQSLKSEQKYNLKPREQSTGEKLLESFKSKTPGVNQLASKYQVNLSEKEVKTIDDFVKKTEGPLNDKLNTVEIALYKGIDINEDNLETIHSALTENPDMDVEILLPKKDESIGTEGPEGKKLEDIIDNLKLPENLKEALKTAIREGASIKDAVKAVAKQIVDTLPEQYRDMLKGVLESGGLKDLSDAMISLAKEVALTPDQITAILSIGINPNQPVDANQGSLNFQNDVMRIQELIDAIKASEKASEAKSLNPDALLSVLKEMVSDLQADSRSSKGIHSLEVLVNSDPTVKTFISDFLKDTLGEAVESDVSNPKEDGSTKVDHANAEGDAQGWTSTPELDEATILFALEQMLGAVTQTHQDILQSFDVKTYIVETITEKSAALQAEFEATKDELVHMTRTDQMPTEESVQKAINLLEKTIMKSEVALYTDMGTEKKLLVMSGQLANAQKYLLSGDVEKAIGLIKETHEQLQKIHVNMNPKKIQSFATERVKETLEMLRPEAERAQVKSTTLKEEVSKILDLQKDMSGDRSARDILEVLRSLGLNHEVETAEALSKKTDVTKMDHINENIKEILLKLMKEDSSNRNIEETLMSLTGQQMMNDSGQNQQGGQRFQFFNLPFEDDLEINNMKVYMTGNNNNETLDYKNSELYFGMTLKHLGETGIKIQIKDEKVSVTVMNDHVAVFSEAFSALEQEVNAIGYAFDVAHLEPYKAEKPFTLTGEIAPSEPYHYDAKKGFDFKI
ncbi:hypothetical protein [Fusibacter ferrireducens]|uniref:Flagellar hook-length control protein FliK n=1 Tax=Fusibacter ferrireducens TaxID=2785058 RepID=A0ABR9ZXP1_9FIRM|nr:hypothetical protein [Fusibacter ferrireducens]MBF4695222.1 hypothetical protein [Fusibacter ferrireducens]